MLKRAEQQGFSLIELMITIVVIGILAAIAIPNYQDYVIKSNRAAAQAQMMEIANREQQFLLANRAYVSKAVLEASGYSLPTDLSSRYTYTIDICPGSAGCPASGVPSFSITFTATGAQTGDGNLGLTSDGGKTPSGKW